MAQIVDGQVARTSAASAGTARPFVPTTKRGWLVVVTVTIVAAVAAMFSFARVSSGRIGFIVVDGSSIHRIAPHGSLAVVFPLPCREGDVVSAWAPHGLDQSEDDPRDQSSTFVLKVLKGRHLVSTDAQTTVSDFDLRGRVVAFLPLYKLTGARAPEDYREPRIAKRDPMPLAAVGNPDHPYNRERRAERLARQQTILASSRKLEVYVVWTTTEGHIRLADSVAVTCVRLSREGCMVELRQPTGLKLYLPEHAPHRAEWWNGEGISAREIEFSVVPDRKGANPRVWDVEVWGR